VERNDVVGRDAELAVVDRFLEAARAGSEALVFEGEPGIGKTTIWAAARRRAEASGFRVLACRPAEAETKLAFSALADLLDPVADEALPELPGPQSRALAVALLRADAEGVALDPRAVAAGFRSSLSLISRSSPVVLAIDDAQWLDASSGRAIGFAFRRLGGERVSLLTFQRFGAQFGRFDGAESVQLGPLTLAALHHLLKERLGKSLPRPLLNRIHEAAGGNPFYALEIARVVGDIGLRPGEALPVPADLTQLVLRRVKRLGPVTQEVLLATAAVAQPTIELISAAAGADAGSALEQAETAGVAEVRGRLVRFSHPLYAAAVYSSAPHERRRRLHRRLAEVVTEPEERARHLALAADGADSAVADELDAAAQAARRRGSAVAAAELEELAIELTPPEAETERDRRQLQLAEHLMHGGDADRARPVLENLIRRLPTGALRAQALLELAALRYWGEGAFAGIECCEQALEAAGSDRALQAKCHADIAVYCEYDLAKSERHARTALSLFEELGAAADRDAVAEALGIAARASLVRGRGLPLEDVLRAIELEDPEPGMHVGGRSNTKLGQWLKYVDDLDGSCRRLEQARREAHEIGDDSSLPNILMHLAQAELWRGDWARALAYAQEACELAEMLGQHFGGPPAYLAQVDAHLGRVERARASATEGLALVEASAFGAALYLRVLGFLELSLGEPAAAAEHLERGLASLEAAQILEPGVLRIHADAVEALVAAGELGRARGVLEPWEEQGARVGLAWSLAMSARCRALLEAAQGDLAGALRSIHRALTEHERLPMPFELGRTLLVAGQIERRGKQKATARESLAHALRIFEELGAPLWAERARAELQRVGLRHGPGELTETEQRVAELAASGLTNREVAAHLFMSPKTVEANLARAYRKLGIRSRAELGARLAAVAGASRPG
jgi:DNA-binding CsgD family transcriptional regulator